MKVWSLERCYDYEGSEIEGVFRTKREAEKARDASNYNPHEWRIQEWKLKPAKRKRKADQASGSKE